MLSRSIRCAPTTLWTNLRQLKRARILQYGDATHKGLPVQLTAIGKLIASHLKNKKTTEEHHDNLQR